MSKELLRMSSTLHCGEGEKEAALRGEAARCRRLAQAVNDPHAVSTLNGMAERYEAEARGQQPLA